MDKLEDTLPDNSKEEDLTEVQKRTKKIVDQINELSTDARLFVDLLASTSGTDRAISCLACLDTVCWISYHLIHFYVFFLQNFKDSLFPKMVFQDHDKKLKRSGNKIELKIQVSRAKIYSCFLSNIFIEINH